MLKLKKKQSSENEKTEDWIILCQREDREKKDVYFSMNDRLHHEYFAGQNDTWKSAIILNQVLEDIKAWNGFCFIDQYWDYTEEILKNFPKDRINDLIYIDFSNKEYPIWINILNEAKNPEETDMITNNIINMFLDMYGPETFWPRLQDYVRNICYILIENNLYSWNSWKHTLFDIIKMITQDLSAFMFHDIKNPVVNYRWTGTYTKMSDGDKADIIPFLQAKLSPLFTESYVRNVLLQPESSIDFSEAVNENKIILCNLARWIVWNLNSEVIWRILMMEMSMVLSRRARMEESSIKPYFLYLDWFQDYVWWSFGDFLLNATRYKIWVTMFNQYITPFKKELTTWSLDLLQSIFNITGTIWSFRIWGLDAEILERFFSPKFSKNELKQLENNTMIMKKYGDGSYAQPILCRVKKYVENIENTPKKIEVIKEISALKWWVKGEIVDKDISYRVMV